MGSLKGYINTLVSIKRMLERSRNICNVLKQFVLIKTRLFLVYLYTQLFVNICKD